MLVAQLCLTPCDPMYCRLLCPWDFPRQEYWGGWPFLQKSSWPRSPTLQADSLLSEPPENTYRVRSCNRRVEVSFAENSGFPGSSDGKASTYNVGDLGLIPGSGRSPEEGNSNPLQYARLENSMDLGAWSATVHGVAKSRTWLCDFTSFCRKFR